MTACNNLGMVDTAAPKKEVLYARIDSDLLADLKSLAELQRRPVGMQLEVILTAFFAQPANVTGTTPRPATSTEEK